MAKKNYLLVLVLFFNVIAAEVEISLDTKDGNNWIVRNSNGSINVNGNVPGGIYTDLQAASILDENLFYRFHDLDYRWVSLENWTYSVNFTLADDVLAKNVINIVFYGVDTIAEIALNGRYLGSIDNMFQRYIFNVKSFANSNNYLEIIFKSAVSEAKSLYEINPIVPACVPNEYQGECHANMVRKMQASFSWDWGPAFPSVGFWKSVKVEAYNSFIIRDVNTFMDKIDTNNSPSWNFKVVIFIEYNTSLSLSTTVDIEGLTTVNLHQNSKQVNIKEEVSYLTLTINTNILYNETNLWWPNGYGTPYLYNLNLTVQDGESLEMSNRKFKIGFRQVELIEEAIADSGPDGLSFYFKVNGVPIFAKGSNWIPAHVLPELGYNEMQVRYLLTSAQDAHMNMLRVWGGGVYESDLFYDIADELGILIWQDMMFACAMYPADSVTLERVRSEITYQVKRLQNHPSIAIWAGNNENEAALRDNWYGTSNDYNRYHDEYKQLYVGVIGNVVQDFDPLRPYVVSSPSNGKQSEKEDYVAANPYSASYGDVHYYNYLSDAWDSTVFPDTRFASEYGYQAMPSFISISKVSDSSDWSLASNFSQKRQHHPNGYTEMKLLISYRLPLPDDDGSAQFYQSFIYLSQISQAMSTKTESERYRRDRSKFTEENLGHTMGALYWQLNDVWQAPTWSSIELGGRWKMLHYYAKKFFAPILISPELLHDDTLNIYLISDLLEPIDNVVATIACMKWTDFKPARSMTIQTTLVNATSTLIGTYDINAILSDAGCTKENCFLYFTIKNGDSILSDNFIYPTSFGTFKLAPPTITVESVSSNDNTVTFTLKTDAITPFVWLETEIFGHFSDNGFTMILPEVPLTFTSNDKININDFQSTLTIRSLYDVPTHNYRVNVMDNNVHF